MRLRKYVEDPKKLLADFVRLTHSAYPEPLYLKMLFRLWMGYKLDLENPKSFNEKIQWLKLYDRQPRYTEMVDKILAKPYVASIIGNEYIIPTLKVWDSVDEIDIENMPEQFVLKCNHAAGSNGVVICKDKASFNLDDAKRKLSKAMKKDGFTYLREWPYKNIHRKVFAEAFVEGEQGELRDYKFLVYGGKVKNLFVVFDRNRGGISPYINFYDKDWNLLPFERDHPQYPFAVEKPKMLSEMIRLAEILGKDIPFVRVDFYCNYGKILFGELTFYPGSGFESFQPLEWDFKLGELIHLPKQKIR